MYRLSNIGAGSLRSGFKEELIRRVKLKIPSRSRPCGLGFALDQTLYLDGRTDTGNLNLLGAASLKAKTAWSQNYKQLLETHQIRTKHGKDGNLIIKRYLIDQGKTLVVVFNLKLNAEPSETSAREIWRKQA